MRSSVVGRAFVGILAAGLLVSCTDGDELDDDVTDRTEQTEANDATGGADLTDDVGEDGEGERDNDEVAAEPPASVVTVEPIDAPQSSSEIRVGEIILEFDGEVTGEGTVLTLEEPILFDFDSAALKAGSREALDDVAEVVAFYEDAPVQVIGHTDDQGSRDYNLQLSQERAEAVVSSLTQRGIPTDRLSAEGRAFDEPVASNDTDEGRAENRRVEVLIVGVAPPDQE